MTHYTVSLFKDGTHHNNLGAIGRIQREVVPAADADGIGLFGIFAPLFGLASNELYVVTWADHEHEIDAPGLTLVDRKHLVPTARPGEPGPRTEPGIYVFRWFTVPNRNVDEIVRLSTEAWVSFEGGFDTEVQGLFAEANREADTGTMLLITWYRNLAVWEASRQPSPEARQNFMRRAELTVEARPIATRLVTPPA